MASVLQLAIYLGGLAAITSGACIHESSLLRRDVGQSLNPRAVVTSYGYHEARGPVNWWNLDPANSELCAKGRNQTPINIRPGSSPGVTTVNNQVDRPQVNYPRAESAKFENKGTTVETTVTGSMRFAGQDWTLLQFHVHTPSEHHLSNEHYPLEVHFVHQRTNPLPDGTRPLAVLGAFFQAAQSLVSVGPLDVSTGQTLPQPFRATLRRVGEISSPGSSIQTGPLDFTQIARHFRDNVVYQYSGSLTTPPCSEGVTWGVSGVPFAIDIDTYNAVKGVVKYNARHVQNDLGQENVIDLAADLFCPA